MKGRNKTGETSHCGAKGRNLPEMTPKATVSEKNTLKTLTGKQQTAAVLVAEDRLTNQQIADSLGVARRTLDRWKCIEAFMECALEAARELSKEAQKQVIAGQERRIAEREAAFGAEIRQVQARCDAQATARDRQAGRGRVVPVHPSIYVPPDDDRPKNVMDALLRPTRDSMCLNSDPMHSSWRG